MPSRSTPTFEDWPEADRAAWAQAILPGDFLDEGGPASGWSPETRRKVLGGYARWLAYLSRTDESLLDLPPAARVTSPMVRQYLAEACVGMQAISTWNFAGQLHNMMRVTAPNQNWGWLKALVARLAREIRPKSKYGKLVGAPTLLALGTRLMDTARDAMNQRRHAAANQYRDGLLIALLAHRPLRRANIAAIRIGVHLVSAGRGYALVFAAQETKNRRPLEMSLPADLALYLEHYLTVIRPRFPRASSHDGLWASEKGFSMDPSAIYDRVRRRTRDALGIAVNLHSIRDSAATLLAEEDVKGHNNARDLLGHARFGTTERHYIHSDRRKAVIANQLVLRRLREQHGRTQRMRKPASEPTSS